MSARRGWGGILVATTLATACSQSQVDTLPDTAQSAPPTNVEVVHERAPAHVKALEADDTYLYWTEGSGLLVRAPKSGAGPVVELGTWYGGDISKHLIAVDATHVFWVENTHINRWSKTDGSTTQIELGDPGSGGWSIVEQDNFLYFTESRCMKFGRVPKFGGTPVFVSVPEQPDGNGAYVAVDDSHVFCGHRTQLWMAPKEGGTALPLAVVMLHEAVGTLVSDGSDVYWINKRVQLGTHQENLAMVSKAGGAIRNLGTIGLGAAVLRLDSKRNHLYWTTYGAIGRSSVFSFSLAGRELTTLADKQTVFGGMAQDDQYVYWAAETAIMRVPK